MDMFGTEDEVLLLPHGFLFCPSAADGSPRARQTIPHQHANRWDIQRLQLENGQGPNTCELGYDSKSQRTSDFVDATGHEKSKETGFFEKPGHYASEGELVRMGWFSL
jgi:hypothetical protein